MKCHEDFRKGFMLEALVLRISNNLLKCSQYKINIKKEQSVEILSTPP